MSLHRHLDDELTTLRSLIADMSNLVDEQLADATNAVVSGDKALAQKVRERDDHVDALELKIDHECERLFALYTPVAVDLRFLITIIKVNTDFERVGDQAKNIAKSILQVAHARELVADLDIREMADLARGILRDAEDALLRRDRVLAHKVIVQDTEVDAMYGRLFSEIVHQATMRPDWAKDFAYLTHIIKSIERVADHAKNIAEAVIFLIEGVDIRHRRKEEIRNG